MTRAQIEVVFSPARPDLDAVPGMHADPGGFVYRVRDHAGRVRIGGSSRGLDPLNALEAAKRAAIGAGLTEWRVWNGGGSYVPLG